MSGGGTIPHYAAGEPETAEAPPERKQPIATLLKQIEEPQTLREAVALMHGWFEPEELDGWLMLADVLHKMPEGGKLTAEQSKAVYLYTLDCEFCKRLNKVLREDATKRGKVPFTLPYLRLLAGALSRAPLRRQTVYRGIGNLDRSVFEHYEQKVGDTVVWYQVNSCTWKMDPLDEFLKGEYMVFAIEGAVGADITEYSAVDGEAEVVLFACSRYKVDSCSEKGRMVKLVAVHEEHKEYYDLHGVAASGEGSFYQRAPPPEFEPPPKPTIPSDPRADPNNYTFVKAGGGHNSLGKRKSRIYEVWYGGAIIADFSHKQHHYIAEEEARRYVNELTAKYKAEHDREVAEGMKAWEAEVEAGYEANHDLAP